MNLQKNKPYHKFGIEWVVRRGRRPVNRARRESRNGPLYISTAVEAAWIIYADGREIGHNAGTLKGVQVWIDFYSQECNLDGLAAVRVSDLAYWKTFMKGISD